MTTANDNQAAQPGHQVSRDFISNAEAGQLVATGFPGNVEIVAGDTIAVAVREVAHQQQAVAQALELFRLIPSEVQQEAAAIFAGQGTLEFSNRTAGMPDKALPQIAVSIFIVNSAIKHQLDTGPPDKSTYSVIEERLQNDESRLAWWGRILGETPGTTANAIRGITALITAVGTLILAVKGLLAILGG